MIISSQTNAILTSLYAKRNERNIAGMARFGIRSDNVLGVPLVSLRAIARSTGKNHNLALQLWETGVYEARVLAAFIADPKKLTPRQMDRWVKDFDNWAICDGLSIHLFRKTPHAHTLARRWARRKAEFIRRAGYVLMATLAVHDTEAPDNVFRSYLKSLPAGASDERLYVRKAVNWTLRQIGKRNRSLNRDAVRIAGQIRSLDTPAARWIASDALRELKSAAVQRRLKSRT